MERPQNNTFSATVLASRCLQSKRRARGRPRALGGLEALRLTVENSSVIDFVVHDPKSDAVSLVLVEYREWGDEGRLVPELHDAR